MSLHKVDGVDGVDHFPKNFVTLRANGAITAGQWVSIDLDDTTNGLGGAVEVAAADSSLVFGVATETVADNALCRIQTAGKYVGASVKDAVTAGLLLSVSETAGMASGGTVSTTYGTNVMCGIALSDGSASDTADVMIINQGYF